MLHSLSVPVPEEVEGIYAALIGINKRIKITRTIMILRHNFISFEFQFLVWMQFIILSDQFLINKSAKNIKKKVHARNNISDRKSLPNTCGTHSIRSFIIKLQKISIYGILKFFCFVNLIFLRIFAFELLVCKKSNTNIASKIKENNIFEKKDKGNNMFDQKCGEVYDLKRKRLIIFKRNEKL